MFKSNYPNFETKLSNFSITSVHFSVLVLFMSSKKQKSKPSSVFLSMKQQKGIFINRADFAALVRFEAAHPELYAAAQEPTDIMAQIQAFNALFYHPEHEKEFKSLILSCKQ